MLIKHLDLKTIGGALTVTLNNLINLILAVIVVNYFKIGTNILKWPDRKMLENWCELFKLGLPTYLLQVFTVVSTETVTLMTGYVSVEVLVANVALINIYYLISLPGLALQTIASSLIGNKIGEGNLQGARNMIKATVIIGVSAIILGQIVFYLVSLQFTNSEMLIIYPITSLALVTYCLSMLLVTILIGLGLQKSTMFFNIFSYVIFGIPISCYLTFHIGWIYYGPWLGLTIATTFNCCYFYNLIQKNDLQKIIENSRSRYEKII